MNGTFFSRVYVFQTFEAITFLGHWHLSCTSGRKAICGFAKVLVWGEFFRLYHPGEAL